MTSKQRVLTTFDHREPDRVPINYFANAAINRRLKAHYGVKHDDDEGLRRALGVDFRSVGAPYTGPALHADIPERGIHVDLWGIRRRWVEHTSGGYWDYCDFPLKDADRETVANWPMPAPDHYDYSRIREQCEALRDFCVVTGGAGLPDVINSTGMIRTMEQTLVDLMLDEPAGLTYIDRRIDVLLEVTRRTLDAAHGDIDLLMMPGGGYCFAPTHALQDNSPTENVVAMYETAHRHGRY